MKEKQKMNKKKLKCRKMFYLPYGLSYGDLTHEDPLPNRCPEKRKENEELKKQVKKEELKGRNKDTKMGLNGTKKWH